VSAAVAELAAARFSHWQRFFAAFLDVGVSMVTKNGNVELNVCKRGARRAEFGD